MSKPSWDDAPDWAVWLARDENGNWFWYDTIPYLNHDTGKWWNSKGMRSPALIVNDYLYSIETRP